VFGLRNTKAGEKTKDEKNENRRPQAAGRGETAKAPVWPTQLQAGFRPFVFRVFARFRIS
jgi:hypothetical protein